MSISNFLLPRFQYTCDDFDVINLSQWGGDCKDNLTKFDKELQARWVAAMAAGHFRYTLCGIKTRVLPGDFGIVAQLNERRAVERRKPASFDCINQPFDPDQFNFTKIKPHEVLFAINSKNDSNRNLIIINVSPLEYYHVLLVPRVDACLPQVLTEYSLLLAIEMLLLSSQMGFQVGFNSLCAMASVNQLHFHAYYIDQPLLVQQPMDLKPVNDVVYETVDHPARGFVLQLFGQSLLTFARNIYRTVAVLQQHQIAHNLFLTRGPVLKQEDSDDITVRAFLWPRKSLYGAKSDIGHGGFNVATCELAGHVPTYTKKCYESLTEGIVMRKWSEVSLPPNEFDSLKKEIRDAVL